MPDTATQESLPRLNPQTLHLNLVALAGIDPALATRLESVNPATDGWAVASARDGHTSFSRKTPADRTEWLGRTSIPTVRATALLEQFDPGHANVLLPGIGEGIEAVRLLAKLGCHQAVFVVEESEIQLQLALRLHDFHEAIAQERLILLACPVQELSGVLLEWLRKHPGHLCPERILMWPWQRMMDLAELRNTVESIFHRVQGERQAELDALRVELASRPLTPQSVHILALHAREETWTRAQELIDAAHAQDLDVCQNILRGPGDMHPLSGARGLSKNATLAENAILLDIFRPAVSHLLSDKTRALVWLTGLSAVPADLPNQLGSDGLAVATPLHYQIATQTDIRPDLLHVVPPFCPSPALADSPEWQDRSGICVIGDLSPDSPASYGINLTSHVHLWTTANSMLEKRVDRIQHSDMDELLGRAEKQSGVTLAETDLRRSFLNALQIAAQSVLCRAVADAVRKAGFPLTTCGNGWSESGDEVAESWIVSRRIEQCRKARIVLHVDWAGTRVQEALLAAGSGALLVARQTDWDDRPCGLATLLTPGQEYLHFGSISDLLAILKRVMADAESGRRITSQARERCRRDHTPFQRLQALRAILTS